MSERLGPSNPCEELSLPPYPEFEEKFSKKNENIREPEDASKYIDPKTGRDSRIADPREDLEYIERRLYRGNAATDNARAKG